MVASGSGQAKNAHGPRTRHGEVLLAQKLKKLGLLGSHQTDDRRLSPHLDDHGMPTEADTCRKHVVPLLQAAGWEIEPHSIAEQRSITDGRIVPVGKGFIRRPPKRVDYLLRLRRDFPIAIVEAKAEYKAASDGLQQAKDYAEMLGLKFAYATNGLDIIEFDYFTGLEIRLTNYPTPEELWKRYRQGSGLIDSTAERILEPCNYSVGKGERYYQQIAIHRTVEAILKGQQRLLLTMATGTGKTVVAFQVCWKLWNARWNRTGEHRRPKILYLADRNILVDQPKDGIFAAFGDARCKIESGEAVKSREMYFAIYQALAEDQNRDGLFKQFPPDFFDLIIVDECHRGSARDDSSWRAILDYFEPAYKLGMTATPLREDNRDTYNYFGDPLYTYSLRQGIEDGFLAPYRVHRVITEANRHCDLYPEIPPEWPSMAVQHRPSRAPLTFNPWLYQGQDDAKAALMEEISRILMENAKENESALEKITTFASRVNWLRVGRLGAEIGASMLVGGPVGALLTGGAALLRGISDGGLTPEEANGAEEGIQKLGAGAKGLMKPAKKETPPQLIHALRTSFEEILKDLDVTLVVFVDDLDRCLPPTVIGTLEAMRLFLFMKRTAFVIAADDRMIKEAVRLHFQGARLDDDLVVNYFDKLIQVPLRVPPLGVNEVRAYRTRRSPRRHPASPAAWIRTGPRGCAARRWM